MKALDETLAGAARSGIGRYVEMLQVPFHEVFGIDSLRFSVRKDSDDLFPHRLVGPGECRWSWPTWWPDRLQGVVRTRLVRSILRRGDVDFCHFPSMHVVPTRGVRVLTTVHDIFPLVIPKYFNREEQDECRRYMRTIRDGGVQVVTVSEASSDDLVRIVGIARDRISVVAHYVDEKFFAAVPLDPARRLALGIDREYLLYVGRLTRHKNVAGVLRAFDLLPNYLKVQLVLAGRLDRRELDVPSIVANMRRGRDVLVLNYLAEEDLPGLYASARAFVSPSFYEGFGLTHLEAMASGVPVVATRRGSLSEICGEAAVYVEPEDVDDICRGMQVLLTSSDFHSERSDISIRQAKRFSRTSFETRMNGIYSRFA